VKIRIINELKEVYARALHRPIKSGFLGALLFDDNSPWGRE
jgi:hypothetical protein